MINQETSDRLLKISREEWEKAIGRAYSHLKYKLWGKTKSGAHSSQRLGADPFDYYVSKCINGIYSGKNMWAERFKIAEQMIRTIDSMISEEVRKYKVEIKKLPKTELVENNRLTRSLDNEIEDVETNEEEREKYLAKITEALTLACAENKTYQEFIRLKKSGLNNDEICTQLKCTKKESYQMMETISRRAINKLESLQTNQTTKK